MTAPFNPFMLSSMKEHDVKTIRLFSDPAIANKLLSLGILPGLPVEMVRVAPFSGGFYIRVNGLNIAVRKTEADTIIVE